MAEKICCPGPLGTSGGNTASGGAFREAVCVHTSKVYDSCRSKECLRDIRVYLTRDERCEEHPLPNLRFVSFDAAELREVFAPAEVDRIYLNFSDPWPPNRQRKRRLTWRAYLEVYDEILRQQGDLCFKTDNQRFFEWSLQEICQFGWLLQNISLDLHNSDFEGNVMTEYEEKFSSEGSRIYRVEARRRLPEFLRK